MSRYYISLPIDRSIQTYVINIYEVFFFRVRLFRVPAFTPEQAAIPYARVNHNKYLLTETAALVGTSNWSADYFIWTGGIGLVMRGPLRDQLNQIFLRDWDSSYARDLAMA